MTIEEIIEELKNLEFYDRPFDNSITADRKLEAVASAIKALEELKSHREAWEKVRKGLRYKHRESYSIGVDDAMKIVDKYRPKEGENE